MLNYVFQDIHSIVRFYLATAVSNGISLPPYYRKERTRATAYPQMVDSVQSREYHTCIGTVFH
jgi:hypothetical protein